VHVGDLRRGREVLQRVPPQRDDQPRRDDLQLALQERHPVGDLRGARIAVLRRARLDDIRDPHVLAREARRGQQLVEQPARTPDERPAERVLGRPRRLAHEDDGGTRVALARHHPRGGLARLEAAPAVRDDLRVERAQSTSRRWTAHRESS
jgi:hypothetical protein